MCLLLHFQYHTNIFYKFSRLKGIAESALQNDIFTAAINRMNTHILVDNLCCKLITKLTHETQKVEIGMEIKKVFLIE